LVSLAAIVFAKSTGALIALSTTAILAGLYYKKTRYFAVGLVFLALILIPLTPLRQPVGEEVLLRGRSGLIRLNMWGETVEMLRTHPILGAGLAGYQTAVEPYHILSWAEIYLYPHNLFLNFWTETGLLGLVGFLWLVVLFFKLGIEKLIGNWKLEIGNLELTKTKKNMAVVLLASMCIILVHGLVDVPYFKNDLAVVFWLLLGLVII
jgi:O-antigen ligase